MDTKPPLPPFTLETAAQKVRLAEDAWNSRDPARVAQVYTEDTRWRNRAEFPVGRQQDGGNDRIRTKDRHGVSLSEFRDADVGLRPSAIRGQGQMRRRTTPAPVTAPDRSGPGDRPGVARAASGTGDRPPRWAGR